MSGLLDAGQQATLIVLTINSNPHKNDLVESKLFHDLKMGKPLYEMGCCWRCCAGCAVLKDLIDADDLNYILKLAPWDLGVRNYSWWDKDQDCFDLSWADAWWELFPCPNHEDAE